ncbi:uncharacterized protein LOC135846627 [Planococcus citri]|uniref:uncharacterized protein LOC135846627 n=1 Tax=Planococcus citri TaxID=170843 RepID=UPI0031F7BF51
MNIINDDVLHSILTSKHDGNLSSFRILDWHINDNILKAGSNYCTQVSQLSVRYQPQTQQDESSTLEGIFFLKVPANAPLYEVVKEWGSYDNEVAMYTQVLPQMLAIDDECFSPRQYYSDDEKSLVLEDLSQSRFRCADRVEQLNIEHCFYALRCLAKFHALSVKLETTASLPELVKRDPYTGPDGGWSEDSIASVSSQIPVYLDSLSQNLKDQYPDMVAYFQTLSSPESLTDFATQMSTSQFNVLNHGDFWTNNIMFKYDKYGTVEQVKLIDFQLTLWKSPVYDLIYFIITSVKFELYLKYFPLLMRIYLNTLNRVLGQFNCPTYQMNSLLKDFDDMFPFAIIVLISVLPIIISDPDDPLDTKEMSKDDKFEIDGMAKAYKQKHFQEISAKWFEHFAKKGTMRIDEENTSITTE